MFLFFLRLSCTSEETCESVKQPNASRDASSTCGYLWLLASPFGHGFRSSDSDSRTSQAEAMYYLLFSANTLSFHNASRPPEVRLWTASGWKSLTATGRAETVQAESEVAEGGKGWGLFFPAFSSLHPRRESLFTGYPGVQRGTRLLGQSNKIWALWQRGVLDLRTDAWKPHKRNCRHLR